MAFYPVAPRARVIHLYAGNSAFSGKTACNRVVSETMDATTNFRSVTCKFCNGKARR